MKGIIFSSVSVLGIKHGIKTQTRRLRADGDAPPRYRLGDTLYVKEAIARVPGSAGIAAYEADGDLTSLDSWRWSRSKLSPMFMPRELRRFEITVVDVRAQALHEITAADAWAEGVDALDGLLEDAEIYRCAKLLRCSYEDPQATYLAAWDTIHAGAASAERNPLVHAYTFTVRRL